MRGRLVQCKGVERKGTNSHWVGPVVVVGVHAPLPRFDQRNRGVALGSTRPYRLVLFEPNFVLPFTFAIILPAEVGQIRDPHNSVYGDPLIVDKAENGRHGIARKSEIRNEKRLRLLRFFA